MDTKVIGALLLACLASVAAPVMAGGDTPPSGSPTDGVVKASQHAHTARTITPNAGKGSAVHPHPGDVGGTEPGHSQSGKREPADSIDPMYRGG